MNKERIIVENDEAISAAHHKADSNKWMFFCHGFGSNKKGSYKRRCEKAAEEGFNAVRFDFRGNGESDGEFINQNLSSRIKDLESVINYFNPSRLALFGSSFGGKTAIHSLKNLNPKAIFLKAPVLFNGTMQEYEEIVREKGSFTPHGDKTIDMDFIEDFQKYNFQDALENIECPVYIFHGGSDTTVEFERTAEASKKLETDLEITKFENEEHSFSESAEEQMIENIVTKLDKLL